jgi:hypothetical protein
MRGMSAEAGWISTSTPAYRDRARSVTSSRRTMSPSTLSVARTPVACRGRPAAVVTSRFSVVPAPGEPTPATVPTAVAAVPAAIAVPAAVTAVPPSGDGHRLIGGCRWRVGSRLRHRRRCGCNCQCRSTGRQGQLEFHPSTPLHVCPGSGYSSRFTWGTGGVVGAGIHLATPVIGNGRGHPATTDGHGSHR